MAVKGLYALQNGFMGFEKSGLFFGERSAEKVRIPISCYLVRTGDTTILFDTGVSPRAVPGLLRTDPMAGFTEAHTPGHQSLLVELPESGPVILAGDCCYWQESIDKEIPPGVVWDPTRAMHSIKRLKTVARLMGGRIFPSHDPAFWASAIKAPDAYR